MADEVVNDVTPGMVYRVTVTANPTNAGRVATVNGTVSPRVGRVSLLVFSHDERWYHQRPGLTDASGAFTSLVYLGLAQPLPTKHEYIVVGFVGPDLPTQSVFDSLNDLPAGQLSPPISILREDA